MMGGAADTLGLGSLMEDLGSAMPGIDEAMSFAEVLKLVVSLQFSVVVFDTAPTGHTLRFLQFPDILEKGLGKMNAMKDQFGGMFKQFGSMMGMAEGAEGMMVCKMVDYFHLNEFGVNLDGYCFRILKWNKLEL